MNNVSFDDKIYLYEKHIKQETGGVAFALFCEKSLKFLPTYNSRHMLVLNSLVGIIGVAGIQAMLQSLSGEDEEGILNLGQGILAA